MVAAISKKRRMPEGGTLATRRETKSLKISLRLPASSLQPGASAGSWRLVAGSY
jgi:hypothetical protein